MNRKFVLDSVKAIASLVFIVPLFLLDGWKGEDDPMGRFE